MEEIKAPSSGERLEPGLFVVDDSTVKVKKPEKVRSVVGDRTLVIQDGAQDSIFFTLAIGSPLAFVRLLGLIFYWYSGWLLFYLFSFCFSCFVVVLSGGGLLDRATYP